MGSFRWWMVAVAAAIITVFGAAAFTLTADKTVPQVMRQTSDPVTTTAAAVYRVVGQWQGKVAVFLPDHADPEQVTEVRVALLPQEEQIRLSDGIPVADSRTLKKLMENYLS